MMSHANAKLTPKGRLALVKRILDGESQINVSQAFGVSRFTARKWVQRYELLGEAGLTDKSSRPQSMPAITADKRADRIELLRRKGHTYAEIAAILKMPHSTVGAVCARRGVANLRLLDPPEPVLRYERDAPGDLLHFDTKKLGRITYLGHRITGRRRGQKSKVGYEVLHLCIDDHSRASYAEVLDDECGETTAAFAQRAIRWFEQHGVTTARVMSDNGSPYKSNVFAAFMKSRGIRHIFTRPYTPRTNGKAERLVQTMLREWAYLVGYSRSAHRTALLPKWLHWYNHHRSHKALHGLSPFSRIGNNLCGAHS